MLLRFIFICGVLVISCNDKSFKKDGHCQNLDNYAIHLEYVASQTELGGYNEQYCVLIDFSRHSGLYRMFVVDMEQSVILNGLQGLVAHGSGCGQEAGVPSGFSNVPNSNCSSLGLSVIDRRDYSGWGRNYKYWLKGLDDTNDRMMERVVVLHGWEGIPDQETYPSSIVQSEGCFTVSLDFLDRLDEVIKTEAGNGKILMYAFNGLGDQLTSLSH